MLITIYIIILFSVAVGTTLLAVYVWIYTNQTGAKDFGMMIFGGSAWSWAAALSATSSTLAIAEFFGENIRYTIIPLIPIMLLVFVIEYTGRYDWLRPMRMPPLILIPIITIAINWFSNLRDYFIYDVNYERVGTAILRTSWTRGPWFWVHAGYTYGLVIFSMSLLIRHMLRSQDPYRKHTQILIYGVLVSILTMLPTTLQLIPSGVSLMPLGGAIMAFSFTRAVFRFNIFNVSPVARDVVFDSMDDLAVVLDSSSRITDINQMTEKIFGWKYEEVIGMPLVEVLTDEEQKLVEDYAYSKEAQAELNIGGNIYDMRISPLYDRRKRYAGRLIVFSDVTKRVKLLSSLSESEERFRQFAEHSRDIVWIFSPDRTVEYLSPTFEQFTGIPREKMYNSTFQILRMLRLEDRKRFVKAVDGVLAGNYQTLAGKIVHKDGREFDFEGWGYPIKNEAGEVTRCIGVWRDMTERIQYETRLKKQVDELSVLHAIATAGAEAANTDEMIEKATEIISEIFPEHIFHVLIVNQGDGGLHEHPSYQRLRNSGERPRILKIGEGIIGKVTKTGKSMIVPDVSKEPVYYQVDSATKSELCVPLNVGNQVIGVLNLESFKLDSYSKEDEQLLSTIANQLALVIEKVRLFEEVQQLATTDSLTNLHNRRNFFELANVEFERTERYKHQISVLMIDIDGFKKINDTHGHAVGDELLVTLAKRCCEELREADLMGRYGGEEFVVLMPETDQAGALQIAERLLKRISDNEIETQKASVSITISIGVASISNNIGSLDTLINRADEALYKSKADGGNSVSG